jgi:hypothetical protein
MWRLGNLELQAMPVKAGPQVTVPIEDALGSLDQARGVLDPLDKAGDPSRHLAFERVRGALDVVEQTLLILRANAPKDREVDTSGRAAREFALTIARAAHRAGDAVRREQWLGEATSGDVAADIGDAASRIRTWAQQEDRYLALASAALAHAADRAEGEPKAELLALAADATRRRAIDPESDLLNQARELARRAAPLGGPGAKHAAFLLERLR